MDLERTYPRCHVDHPGWSAGLQPPLELVDAEAQGQIEGHGAVLDQEIVLAALAPGDRGPVAVRVPTLKQSPRSVAMLDGPGRHPAGPGCHPSFVGVAGRHRNQSDPVARAKLAELPAIADGDDRRAHEASQARPVRAEQDRHVAGQVDRSGGVGGVVDVRGVQAGVAPVAPGPPRARPDEAHARAGRIVVHHPHRPVQVVEAGGGEKLGVGVRSLEDGQLPLVA